MYYAFQSNYILSLLIFVIACLTDLLDGYLARKLNHETKLGALLDPLADKLLTIPILLFFSYIEVLNLYIILGLILRDLFITVMRMTKFNTEKSCVKANSYGKYKVVLIYGVLILSFIQEIFWDTQYELIELNLYLNIALALALVLSLMALSISPPTSEN